MKMDERTEEYRAGIVDPVVRHEGFRCEMRYCRRRIWRLLAVLCFVISALPVGARETVDRVVAFVNDDIIALSELNDEIAPFADRIMQMDTDQEKKNEMLFKLREDMLNRLVEQKLTDQEIKKAGISISEAEIDESIEKIKQANRVTEEMMAEALKKQGMTLDEYRDRIKEQMLRSRLVTREVNSKIVVTDEDIKTYYETHRDEFRGEGKVHLRHLTLSLDASMSRKQKDAAREEMTTIRQEIASGKAFQEIEKHFTNQGPGRRGGDLGTFLVGSLSPTIQKAVKAMKTGDVTQVLETDQGLQIFYLQEYDPAQEKTLEEVTDAISEKIYKQRVDEKFTRWLEDLKKTSLIKLVL